jgi:hypothetical protein
MISYSSAALRDALPLGVGELGTWTLSGTPTTWFANSTRV